MYWYNHITCRQLKFLQKLKNGNQFNCLIIDIYVGSLDLLMKYRRTFVWIALSVILSSVSLKTYSQDTLKFDPPFVFLDCKTHCYFDHIRTEIDYVNFVRNRQDADIHMFLTRLRTGSNGSEYTLITSGRGRFEEVSDTLSFYGHANITDHERQNLMARNIEHALIPYLIKTDLRQFIRFDRAAIPREGTIVNSEEDPWNSWLFEFGGNFWFSSVETVDDISASGRMNVSRVTDLQKFNARINLNYNQSNFHFEDDSTFQSVQRSSSARVLNVHSLNEHWSIGGWLRTWSNTFSNYEFGISLRPAVEYNLFPYAEATRRQFTFLYSIGPSYNNYVDSTIFDKTEEWLFSHSLEIDYIRLENWGTIRVSLDYSNFIHDWSLLALSLRPRVSWNIVKGLNLNMEAGVSLFRNQRNIVKSDISREEQLLRIKELGTDYAYSFSFGLSYRFGSVYNNVVNTRF